ncbi:hypothetical protein [Nocardia aurantiaca]|uniref:hypothetical protein n=1 Tax=Nocardia aurantiaca TaxID=2675850 RepID=UPI0018AB73E5|nr:hypothetical protein [Nocardia aurantiaca]
MNAIANGIAVGRPGHAVVPSIAHGIVLAIVDVVPWAALFTLGSAFLFRRDTAR